MYQGFYGAGGTAFSLTPDPRFFYRSPGHEEALSHLLYGVLEGGSFVLLTGEVGTGKTSACRYQLNHLPSNVQVALILNPRLTEVELVASICDELGIVYPSGTTSLKVLVDCLNQHLLAAHAAGQQVVAIIDEAQNLSAEVLEEIRLLTNLQTDSDMLLQIILIGQPELTKLLRRRNMRQLNQRITSRYNLKPLTLEETGAYIRHRLMVGGLAPDLFTSAAIGEIHKYARGVPRLINRICESALLGLRVEGSAQVEASLARGAIKSALGESRSETARVILQQRGKLAAAAAAIILLALLPFGVELGAGVFSGEDAAVSVTAALPPSPGRETVATATDVPADAAEGITVTPAAATVPDNTAMHAVRESAPRSAVFGQTALPAAFETHRAVPPRVKEDDTSETLRLGSVTPLFQVKALTADRDTAVSVLFHRWHRLRDKLRGDGPCEAAADGGLACLEVPAGSWERLADHNRPALIVLTGPGGRKLHAVVVGLTEEAVTLRFGKLQVRMAKASLTPYWSDPALILWQPWSPTGRSLVEGLDGADVVRLRTHLAVLQGASDTPNDEPVFDAALRDQVMTFQNRRGLKADGRVGPRMMILLNGLSDSPTIPQLGNS